VAINTKPAKHSRSGEATHIKHDDVDVGKRKEGEASTGMFM
jgi:hypothetical protein